MNKEDQGYSDITGKVLGAAMQVHSTLGNGFQEVIYQYLEAYRLEIGLLINFGAKSLEYRRVVNSKARRKAASQS